MRFRGHLLPTGAAKLSLLVLTILVCPREGITWGNRVISHLTGALATCYRETELSLLDIYVTTHC